MTLTSAETTVWLHFSSVGHRVAYAHHVVSVLCPLWCVVAGREDIGSEQKHDMVRHHLSQLPPAHYHTLKYLMAHLHRSVLVSASHFRALRTFVVRCSNSL